MSKNSVTGFLINDDPFAGLWVDLRCQAILAVQTIGSIFAVLTVRAILAINTIFAVRAIFTIGSILSIGAVFAISAGITLIALGTSLASQILEEFLNGKIVQCDFISVRINHFASGGNRFLNVSFPHFVRALAVNSIFAGNTGIALIALITFIAFVSFVSFVTLISFGSSISFITLITFISGITFVALVTFGFDSGVMISNPPVSILDIWDKSIRAIVSRKEPIEIHHRCLGFIPLTSRIVRIIDSGSYIFLPKFVGGFAVRAVNTIGTILAIFAVLTVNAILAFKIKEKMTNVNRAGIVNLPFLYRLDP